MSVPAALGLFCAAWKARYGARYVPLPAECKQLRVMLDEVGDLADELPSAFERYLEDLSPFVAQEKRHSLLHFCTSGGFNKYRVTAPVLSAREARGVEAGRRFINGEGDHGHKR